MQEKEYNYNGRRIFYRTKGEGPLVVLLHGFGEDGTIWKNQFDLFPSHELIVPDLPGSGKSEALDDMSMEGLAEAIAPLIPQGGNGYAQPSPGEDSANWVESLTGEGRSEAVDNPPLGGRGALIGHSMGGYITLAFAEKYPERLSAFGLFHSSAFADNEERKQKRRDGIAVMKARGAEAFLKTFVPGLYSATTKYERSGLIDEHLASVRNFSTEALVSYFEAMRTRPDRTRMLRESTAPVLFVMGKHDTAVPLVDGLKQCHLPQLAYIHLLQNSAHEGMVEEVDEANKILVEFIKAVENTA